MSEYGLEIDPKTLLITSPGKFQGEPRWAPYFWEMAMDGCIDGEEDDLTVWFDVIEPDDTDEFPELRQFKVVKLREDANGFVHCHTVDRPRKDGEDV